ncbi:PREDICTED: protein enabled-like, partial [Rhagoletis zephyria]|uniref:protein enabled-like n=1 Tax=Rhagoletis zephyria TaxID=28612 RepID=UPI0008114A3C
MSNPESSIASARASVMVYDDANKKWLPSGTSSGLSRVHIYQHIQNNTFRVVGRKLQDHEVVINCAILKNLKYNQATPIFHQWRENRTVFGLNFSSKEEADAFAHTMMKVIDLLNQNTYGTTKSIQQQPPPQQNSQQPVYGHIGPPEEYGEIGRQQQQNGWNGNPNGGVNNQMQPHNNHINGLVDPQQQQQQQQNGGGPPPMHMQANSHNPQMQQPPPQMLPQMIAPEVVQHHQQLQQQQQQQNMQQLTQHMTNVTLSQAMLQTQATYMSTGNMMNMHRNSVSNVNNSQQQQQQQIQQPAGNIPPPPPPPPPMPTNNGQPMMAPNMVPNNGMMNGGVAPAGPTGAPPPPPPPPPPGLLNGSGGNGGGGGGPPRMVSNGGGQASNIPPAPPMPTMPLGGNSGGPSNLAAAIANAKLKRTASGKVDDNDSLSSNSSSGRTSNTTTAAPGNLMDEMAKTLARRRAQAESNQQNDGDSGNAGGNIGGARNFNGIKSEKQSSTSLVNGCSPSKDESNSHHRKNGPSDESKFNGLCEADMDRLKQEIMTDIRKELQKLKLDIIE